MRHERKTPTSQGKPTQSGRDLHNQYYARLRSGLEPRSTELKGRDREMTDNLTKSGIQITNKPKFVNFFFDRDEH